MAAFPDPDAPDLAASRLTQAIRSRSLPAAAVVQRWVEDLAGGRWAAAERALHAHPELARADLSLDNRHLTVDHGRMPALDRGVHRWGALPFWLANHGPWGSLTPGKADQIVVLLQTWAQAGPGWHRRMHGTHSDGRSYQTTLLDHLGDHAHLPTLWTTLLQAGWPVTQDGWALERILDNPDGDVSSRRLKTALAVVEQQPTLLEQTGDEGQGVWHLLMTSMPAVMSSTDARQALGEQLVAAVRRHDPERRLEQRVDDLGRRPVDLRLPDLDSPLPQDHEPHLDFPYWTTRQWLGDRPNERMEPDLVTVWNRQAMLDADRLADRPDYLAFRALLERVMLQRLDLGGAVLPVAIPRRRF